MSRRFGLLASAGALTLALTAGALAPVWAQGVSGPATSTTPADSNGSGDATAEELKAFDEAIEQSLDAIGAEAEQRSASDAIGAARRADLERLGTVPTPEALAFGRQAAAADPGHFALRLRLADLLAKAGQTAEAQSVAEAVLGDPTAAPEVHQRAILRLAALAVGQGDGLRARAWLERLETMGPSDAARARAGQLRARIEANERDAATAAALARIGRRPTAAALAEARTLYETDPANTDVALFYGGLLASALRYEESEAVFLAVRDRAPASDPRDIERARLGLAGLHIRANRLPEAQGELDAIDQSLGARTPPARAAVLRERIADRLQRHRWRGELSAGLGYDTNARTRTEVVDDDRFLFQVEEDASLFEALQAEGEYRRLVDRQGTVIAVRAEAEQTFFNNESDLDRTTLALGAGPIVKVRGRALELRGILGYRYRLRDYDFARATAYALVSAEQRVTYLVRLRGTYVFEHNQDENDDQDGIAHDAVLELRYDATPRDRLTARLRGRLETADAGFESRRVLGGALSYRHEFAFAAMPGVYAEIVGAVAQNAYRAASGRPEDLGLTRDDLDWRIDLILGKEFGPLWRAELQASYLERRSNIDRNDRDSFRFLVSAIRRFE